MKLGDIYSKDSHGWGQKCNSRTGVLVSTSLTSVKAPYTHWFPLMNSSHKGCMTSKTCSISKILAQLGDYIYQGSVVHFPCMVAGGCTLWNVSTFPGTALSSSLSTLCLRNFTDLVENWHFWKLRVTSGPWSYWRTGCMC